MATYATVALAAIASYYLVISDAIAVYRCIAIGIKQYKWSRFEPYRVQHFLVTHVLIKLASYEAMIVTCFIV